MCGPEGQVINKGGTKMVSKLPILCKQVSAFSPDGYAVGKTNRNRKGVHEHDIRTLENGMSSVINL